MSDPYLISFIRAAEAGHNCPQIRVLTAAGDAIIGQPVPSRVFVERMHGALANQVEVWLSKRPRREREAQPQDPLALSSHALSPLTQPDPPGDGMLTLADVSVMWGGTRGGMAVPAIRVALSGITAWWVAGGQEVKASGGGGWAVGVIFPVDT